MIYVYIIAGLLWSVSFFIGGVKYEETKFNSYKLTQDAALQKANSDALKKQNELQDRSDKVAHAAAVSIKSVRDYYANHPTIVYLPSGVRHNPGGGVQLPQIASAPGGANDPALDAGHITQVIQPDLVARCADTTVRFISLQNWVTDMEKQ